jgi:hypothetical protein
VAGANVAITNVGTSATRAATTDERGEYVISLLPNGKYVLRVEAKGFRTYTVADITLSTGDRDRFNAELKPGSVSEKVEVSAQSEPLLESDSSDVSGTVDESSVQNLPMNGRNFTTVLLLQPGLNSGSQGTLAVAAVMSAGLTGWDRRPASTVNANDAPDTYNNQMIDGFDNNERFMGLVGLRPSVDDIAEIKTVNNDYRAEYGRTAGVVVDVITRAGSNSVHGTAFEYLRNDMFDSDDYFATSKTEYRMNEFGGSVGGPIQKNKTFFFADIEEDRTIQGMSFVTSIPTLYEEENPGDFSDAGGPNLIAMNVPLSKVALKLFKLYPAPNHGTAGQTVNNYVSSPNKTQFATTADGRIDHHFSANDQIFARYAYNYTATDLPGMLPKVNGIYPDFGTFTGFFSPSDQGAQNVQFDYVHIFNSNLLLDLKTGFTRVTTMQNPWNSPSAVAALDIPNVGISGMPQTDFLPVMGAPGWVWDNLGDCIGAPAYAYDNTFQYGGSINYTRGVHAFKFGAALLRRQSNEVSNTMPDGMFAFVASPPFFDPRANFLVGAPAMVMRQIQISPSDLRTWDISGYAQDDWRVTPKLTLNLGVRYDIYMPMKTANGAYNNFDVSTLGNGVGANNFILGTADKAAGIKTDAKDFAPRFGFSYSPMAKTVVRGGFGLSYFPALVGVSGFVGGNPAGNVLTNDNPPYYYSFQTFSNPLDAGPPAPPATYASKTYDFSNYANDPGLSTLSSISRNLRSSYVEQMNLFVQREFGLNVLTVGYAGELGRALYRLINLDQPAAPGAGNPEPAYVYASQLPYVNQINLAYNGGMSDYESLQIAFQRRVAQGLSVNANYTWSHGLANNYFNTDNAHPSYDYGNSALDIRHRVAITGTYELPFGKQASGLEAALIKGWQTNAIVTWQTGAPYVIESDADMPGPPGTPVYQNVPGLIQERPNAKPFAAGFHSTLNEFFDIDAFSPQTPGTYGNEAALAYHGPHNRGANMSVTKVFPLYEQLKLQFRAECFNISNTAQFASPNTTSDEWITDASGATVPAGPAEGSAFGTITATANNSNPRQFQFALKLMF